jgi:hypothetical protein
MIVRAWLSTQSLPAQQQFGPDVLTSPWGAPLVTVVVIVLAPLRRMPELAACALLRGP